MYVALCNDFLRHVLGPGKYKRVWRVHTMCWSIAPLAFTDFALLLSQTLGQDSRKPPKVNAILLSFLKFPTNRGKIHNLCAFPAAGNRHVGFLWHCQMLSHALGQDLYTASRCYWQFANSSRSSGKIIK